MKLVLVADVGPALAAYFLDSGLIELASFFEHAGGECATQRRGAGAALFEASFVEVGVGVGVEEFMCELRWDWCIDGEAADGSVFDSAEDFDQAFEIHRFLEDVFHHLVHEGMAGDLNIALDGLEAGGCLWEDGGHEVVGTGPLNLRGNAFAFGHAQQLQTTRGGPAPAVFEDWRSD